MTDIIKQAMERIAQQKPGNPARLIYDKARRTIIEIPVDPKQVPRLLIYDEDADFTCPSRTFKEYVK